MTYDNTSDVVDESFQSDLLRYQIGLETLMRGSHFIFDSAQLFNYKYRKISFKRGS